MICVMTFKTFDCLTVLVKDIEELNQQLEKERITIEQVDSYIQLSY